MTRSKEKLPSSGRWLCRLDRAQLSMHLFAAPDFYSGLLHIVLSFPFLVTSTTLWLLQPLNYVEIPRQCCA